MKDRERREVKGGLLEILPPVDFACVYGSSLLSSTSSSADKSTMIDYIVGVSDPIGWHSQCFQFQKNLKMNRHHYASWMVHFGGADLITKVADKIGVGVHFNPFVTFNDSMYKYGVVRMQDLIQDVLNWDRLYLSGRLQKPVHLLIDNLDIENVNSVNLRAATSAALLLLPSKFTEVKKIVQGQFHLFQMMYKPILEDYAMKDLLRFHYDGCQANMTQDCSLSAAQTLVGHLAPTVRRQMGSKLGKAETMTESGRVIQRAVINSREEIVRCMQTVVRRIVMVSSARQAVSGILAVGGVNAARYLGRKMSKAWKSWT
ncbi:Phosphatidate cytidylyltransferase, mitochondrial [Dillenia turbinata]|uniref:Phosphatidate cytidylyltransferase, mitochondrial n=1 Tax=Dillenia turbinata TaxID=194707 RepID=A0AAN8VR97_9MAGN